MYFTYPETAKVTLEEVSIIFDGKRAVENAMLDKQDAGEEVDGKGGETERVEEVRA